jgi:hypothetical protein
MCLAFFVTAPLFHLQPFGLRSNTRGYNAAEKWLYQSGMYPGNKNRIIYKK